MSRKDLIDYFYVLYDKNDNLIACFYNYDELKKITNVPKEKINYFFKQNYGIGENYIYILVYNKIYKLYRYNPCLLMESRRKFY